LIFKVKGQGHRVKFLGEGIRHALPLFSLDLVSMIYKQDFNMPFLKIQQRAKVPFFRTSTLPF
jgi:hypothetical protein